MANSMMPYDSSVDVTATNENTYGGIADSYAQKYGIPTDVFRDIIRSSSGFDPQQKSSTGKGIANLNFSGADSTLPNPSDVGSSLDWAAQYVSAAHEKYGNWDDAKKVYPGAADTENGGVGSNDVDPNGAPVDNSFFGKYVAFLKNSGYTILIVAVGILLILGSTWVLINSSGSK